MWFTVAARRVSNFGIGDDDPQMTVLSLGEGALVQSLQVEKVTKTATSANAESERREKRR